MDTAKGNKITRRTSALQIAPRDLPFIFLHKWASFSGLFWAFLSQSYALSPEVHEVKKTSQPQGYGGHQVRQQMTNPHISGTGQSWQVTLMMASAPRVGNSIYLVYVFHPVLAILHLQPPWAHLWISDTLTLQALLTNGGEILGWQGKRNNI